MEVIIFDTETTGLLKPKHAQLEKQPRIIELGALKIGTNGSKEELSQIIDPKVEIEPIITKITGIKQEDLEGKPTFADYYPKLKSFFSGADFLVCHNAPFDKGMLQVELARLGDAEDFNMPEPVCTVQEFHSVFGRRAKLTEVYKHFVGKELEQTHRALDDVMALYEVMKKSGLLEEILCSASK